MAGMAKGNEKFTEKLINIAKRRGLSKSQLAGAAGTTPQAIDRYWEGAAPRLHNAIALADALGVDPVYLFDEDEPWRDNFPKSPAQSVGDKALMIEAATRYAAVERKLAGFIERAEALDWKAIGEQAVSAKSSEQRPANVDAAIGVAKALFFIVRSTIDLFDSVRVADRELKKTRGFAVWLPEANSTRRQAFVDRIDAIYSAFSVNDEARKVLMGELQGGMWITDDADDAFELIGDALKSYENAAG